MQKGNKTRRWQEVIIRIFCIDTTFNSMARKAYILLYKVQRLTSSNTDLCPHQINACYQLRNTMFYLDTRVNFHEEEIIGSQVQEEFYGTYVGIVNGLSGLNCQLPYPFSHFFCQSDGWRFFNQFLVAPLDGAFPFTQVQYFTIVIGYDLHFNVAGPSNIMFKVVLNLEYIHLVFEDIDQFFFIVSYSHTLTAATSNWFQDNWVAYFTSSFDSFFIGCQRIRPLGHRNAGWHHGCTSYVLIADQPNGIRVWSNPYHTVIGNHFCKVSVFREESIARMNRISLRI